MKRVIAFLPIVLAVAACEPPTVPPRTTQNIYDFRLPTSPPAVLRWPSGSTIRVFIASDAARADEINAAFDLAVSNWNGAARYREYELARASTITDADAVIRWSDEPSDLDFTACTIEQSVATTTFCLDDTDPTRLYVFPLRAPLTGSRVRIVVTVLGTESGRNRVERLVAHELGHVLGLARHSLDANDLMFGGNLTRSTLSSRDSASVQVLYHTRAAITP
jgi:predicted Zn-dependent protease